MVSMNSNKICGYQLTDIIETGLDGILYRAIEEKSGKSILLRLINFRSDALPMPYPDNSVSDLSVDHEIVISNPPCPANLDQTRAHDFPVFIDGKLIQFRLNSGVRKPGYWATTAVRVARKYMKRIHKDDLKILDLGCGCGLIGILLGLDSKVSRVVFSDINKEAIASTIINAERMGISRYETLTGDLFDGIASRHAFDIIVFGPPFYPDIIPTAYTTADVGGPRGTEIAERYANDVAYYLSSVGYSITYLADFVEYPKVLHALNRSQLITRLEERDILYPYNPDHGFPQCNEILWKKELESLFDYKFKEYTFCNKRFIGFKMFHFISQLKDIEDAVVSQD